MRPDNHWTYRANCLNEDTEIFFSTNSKLVKIALEICDNCQVRIECLWDNEIVEMKQAKAHNKFIFGIFGGETPDERKYRRSF